MTSCHGLCVTFTLNLWLTSSWVTEVCTTDLHSFDFVEYPFLGTKEWAITSCVSRNLKRDILKGYYPGLLGTLNAVCFRHTKCTGEKMKKKKRRENYQPFRYTRFSFWAHCIRSVKGRYRLFSSQVGFTNSSLKWPGTLLPSPTPHGLLFYVAVIWNVTQSTREGLRDDPTWMGCPSIADTTGNAINLLIPLVFLG